MPNYLARTVVEMPLMRDEPLAQQCYLDANQVPLPPGTRLRNPALAATRRQLGAEGAAALYEGPIGAAIAAAVATDMLPGPLTVEDLRAYRAEERAPLRARLGDQTVLTAPPPVFGGMAMGQILGLMAALGLLGRDPVADDAATHALLECGRLAFADRGAYIGDPAFVDSPAQALLDPGYLAERAKLVDPERAMINPPGPGTLPGVEAAPPGGGMGGTLTTHMSCADADGLTVAMTSTLNLNFGSKLSVGGFYLNNVLTNFARAPVKQNRVARNAMAPGKRAMTSFSPALLLDTAGTPRAVLGAAGGNRIVGTVANALLRIGAGMTDAQAIVARPHAVHYGAGSEIEAALAPQAGALRARGHYPLVRRLDGCSTNILLRAGEGWSIGVDPRRDGRPG